MFALCVKIIVCLAVVYIAVAIRDLPERARGGSYFKEWQKRYDVRSNLMESKAYTLQAKLDHFSNTNNETFSQRYYVDDQYWNGNGPIFFEIGGEGTLTGAPAGFIGALAQQYNALILALEHRFYGDSVPNNDASTENYQYLTVEQALADLSYFTDFYRKQDSRTASLPWVVFGGSYPGALSSWYRAAYPQQSIGSLSSSGVVNCIVDYYDFDMSVSAAAGNECADNIRRVQGAFRRSIEESDVSTGKISNEKSFQAALSLFNCEADMSLNDFYYMIADSWSMTIQYSAKSQLCSAVDLPQNSSDDEVMRNFAKFSNSFWGDNFCSGGFYNTKQLADPKRWDINSRSWRYQTCAQVSYFNTAPPSGSLRSESVDLKYHLDQCAAVFGKRMFPASLDMNKKFGGAFPHATNVFYSDFSDDPWQRASVDYPVSSTQPYSLAQCDDCGHCLDFHAPSASDPAPLTATRNEFQKYLAMWLNDAKP